MNKGGHSWLWLVWVVGCASARAEGAPSTIETKKPGGVIQVEGKSIKFSKGPASMPAGVELAVLEGDPKQTGIFTLRLKAPKGFVLAPHTHPVAERVTVISGALSVGFGNALDKAQARKFTAGDFYVNPPGSVHYVFSDEGAIIQITGMGPWKVDFLASH